jgi:hypothetical protein
MDGEEEFDRPRRGHRFTLQLPVRFRAAGDARWQLGTTENVSRSGVMIRAASAPAADAQVDVLIALPYSDSEVRGCLLGHGRVVRRGEAGFAVTVPRYTLRPLKAR